MPAAGRNRLLRPGAPEPRSHGGRGLCDSCGDFCGLYRSSGRILPMNSGLAFSSSSQ